MKNKTSAVIRIIISSLLILTFFSILLWGIEKGGFSSLPFFGIGEYTNSDRYKEGNASLIADSLNEIEVNWVDGEVNITPYNGQTIELEETSSGNLSKREQMHYFFENGTLIIQYRRSGFFFINSKAKNKNLSIRIPSSLCENLQNVSVDAASCDINVDGLHSRNFDFDTVSGNVKMNDIHVTKECNLETVSGDYDLSGEFQELDMESVSGNYTVRSSQTPEKINYDGVSGDLSLQIPYSSQFTLELDTVSGNLKNTFAANQEDDTYVCGNGDAKYNLETVSGDITIYYP